MYVRNQVHGGKHRVIAINGQVVNDKWVYARKLKMIMKEKRKEKKRKEELLDSPMGVHCIRGRRIVKCEYCINAM